MIYEQLFASLCGYSDKQVLSFQGSNSATMLKLCNNYFTVEHVKINHNSELRIFFRPFPEFFYSLFWPSRSVSIICLGIYNMDQAV